MEIMCVLKSGGCYTPEYVDKLFNSISRNTTTEFSFTCLTDVQWSSTYICIPLLHDWEGWWSKIEAFNYTNVLYIDLDTVIVDNIDKLLSLPSLLNGNEIFMMKAANPNRSFTTSIMAWNDMRYVYDNFLYPEDLSYQWDQYYVLSMLEYNKTRIRSIQNEVPGIHSYKREWLPNHPLNSCIVWFHGKPRLHKCDERFVKRHWR